MHYHHGVKGLLEDGENIWKYMPDRAGHVEDTRHHDTSRSPRIARTSSTGVGDRPHDIATVDVEAPQGNLGRVRSTYWDMPLLHVRPGNIQKVMYINLARRTDRRALILSELATLEIAQESITRIEAIDAEDCEESPLECCARSHIAALEQVIFKKSSTASSAVCAAATYDSDSSALECCRVQEHERWQRPGRKHRCATSASPSST